MANLTLESGIPLHYSNISPVSGFFFHRWIPSDPQDNLIAKEGPITITLFFDREDMRFLAADAEIEKTRMIHATKVRARIEVSDLNEKLAEQIRLNANELHELQEADAELLKEIGRSVMTLLLKTVNRIVDYARDEKGQYWLDNYSSKTNNLLMLFQHFDTKARIDNGHEFTFLPSNIHSMEGVFHSPKTLVGSDDWQVLKESIQANRNTDPCRHFLTSAKELAARSYYRDAVVESVTAMEIAINRFVARPNLKEIGPLPSERLMNSNLHSLQEKLGIRGTIALLIPWIFSEHQISLSSLEFCSRALEIRNNIVHDGRREVDREETWKILGGIETVCESLILHTVKRESH